MFPFYLFCNFVFLQIWIRHNNDIASTNWGPFKTSPLAPRGEICSIGGMFTTLFTPRGEHSLLFTRMEGWTDNFSPRGYITWTLGGQNSPPGTTSPLRPILNFAPRGKLWPQGWSYPLGAKFSVRPSILLNSRVFTPGGERSGEHFPYGINFTPGGQGWS
jgi:hypothetical protein